MTATSRIDPAPEPVGPATWTNVPANELDMASLTGVDNELATSGFGPERARRVTGGGTGLGIVGGRLLHHRAARLGLIVLVFIALLAFTSIGVGPIPGWWKYNYTDFEPALVDHGAPTLSVWPPAWGDHPFGQSNEGRDYFALTMRGVQQSLTIAFIVGIVSTVIGAAIGAVSGYFRGAAESVLMRLTDVVITIPLLAVAAVITRQIGGSGVVGLAVLLGFVTWTSLARIVRGEFLSMRELEFVDAARSVGASNRRIIIRHLLPNAVGVITVSATLTISFTIQLEAALSFLNFGVRSPDISLGTLLEQYRQAMSVRPYLFWWPGVFIVAMSLSINFIGDGLRDAFDPRHSIQVVPHRTARRDAPQSRPAGAPAPPAAAILSVRDLGVDFWVGNSWRMACEHVDFEVLAGEVVALVGESGSGKSTAALSMLDLLPPNSRVAGSVRLLDRELIGARPEVLRQVRGGEIGMVFQDPTPALNPVLTVGFQINEALLSHVDLAPGASRRRVIELMELVNLPDPEERLDFYPHQLSGGQQQRVMIAMALACDPVLLVADEPTTALDVTVQAEILDLLRSLRARLGLAVLLITHDLGVVADLADRVVVMRAGRIVEADTAGALFAHPQNAHTRDLIAAVPRIAPAPDVSSVPSAGADPTLPPALEVVDLTVDYHRRRRVPPVRAVDQVSFSVARGEILGLVGESGAGKSTIGRTIAGLLPVSSGCVKIAGIDTAGQSHRAFKRQCARVAIVFQDPASALNPRLTIGESIGEPLFLHENLRRGALAVRVEHLLDQVHLGGNYRFRYPHELSGGERQRVGIARALSLGPELLVADEPTSALDMSVQAHILELMKDLQSQHGFACLFISHDLAVVANLAKQVAVLRRGRLVEIGPTEVVLHHPSDPYTRRLVADSPVADPAEQARRRKASGAERIAHD